MIDIDVQGTAYPVPSSAADENWATRQVAFQKALANAVNNVAVAGEIDAAVYGVSVDNSGTANNAAFSSAVSAAISANKTLFISAGEYLCNFHGLGGSGNGAITLSGNITVRGSGKGKTILKADGYVQGVVVAGIITVNNDANTSLFDRTGGTHDVTIQDMTLEGPDAGTITNDISNCWGVYSRGGGGSLTLSNVETLLWNQAVKTTPDFPSYPGLGTKLLIENGCYIGYLSGLGILCSEGNTDYDPTNTFSIRDSTIEYNDFGSPTNTNGPTSNGEYPCTYIGSGVAYEANNVWYKKSGQGIGATSTACGFLHFGGTHKPLFSRAINCRFDDCQDQIITCGTALTQLTHCEIRTRSGYVALTPRNDVQLNACHFFGEPGAQYGISDQNGNAGTLTATGCTFGSSSAGDGYVYAAAKFQASTKAWSFVNCIFNDSYSSGFSTRIEDGLMVFSTCLFAQTAGLGANNIEGGHTVFKDCKWLSKAPVVDATAAIIVELWDSTFEAGADLFTLTNIGFGITIRGGRNRFDETSSQGVGFALGTGTGVGNLSGAFQATAGIGAYTYDAGVLTTNWNYDTYSVNEGATPTIVTLNMRGNVSGGAVAADMNRFSNATVKLYVQQAFILGTSGNIVAASGVRPVGSIVTLQYFPSLVKWVEVGSLDQVLSKNITPAGTGADTTEDNLMTYTLIGGTMGVDGRGIRVTAWGDGANTSDATTVKGYFGGTVVVTKVLTVTQANTWRAVFEVLRTGATTQTASGSIENGGTLDSSAQSNAAPSETLSGNVTIKFTGQRTVSSVANSVRQLGMIVEAIS